MTIATIRANKTNLDLVSAQLQLNSLVEVRMMMMVMIMGIMLWTMILILTARFVQFWASGPKCPGAAPWANRNPVCLEPRNRSSDFKLELSFNLFPFNSDRVGGCPHTNWSQNCNLDTGCFFFHWGPSSSSKTKCGNKSKQDLHGKFKPDPISF